MIIVFFNGQFIPENEAKILATSSAGLFGEGVFTTMLVDNGAVQFFKEHMLRLKKDARFIGLVPPKIDIENVKTLISLNNLQKGKYRLRITLFSREKAQFDCCKSKRFQIHGTQLKSFDLLMNLIPIIEKEDKDIKLCIYPEIVSTPLSKVKTLNYLNRFMLRNYAVERGFDDVLVLGPNNQIVETSFSNIFWITECTVFVPDDRLPYFRGTTLDLVLKELLSEGYKICEGFFKLGDISENANVYLCGSLKKFACVSQIEKRSFGTRRIDCLDKEKVFQSK